MKARRASTAYYLHEMPEHSPAPLLSKRAIASEFGSALRTFRLAAGLSQEDLAERAGTGVNTISALERGARRAPYRSTVDALATALALGDAQRELLHRAAGRRRPPVGPTAVPPQNGEPLRPPGNNFPLGSTSFIGREREIADIMALVETQRLVTLTGSGGVGKTRTAIEVGADLAAEFRDGAWLIEFGPIASGEYVASTIAHTLGITIGSETDAVETIARALMPKETLLLFDTCEHLVDAIASSAIAILSVAPHVRILATSRQRLNVAVEATYRIPPLGLPPAQRDTFAANEAAAYDAVALFTARATRASDRFALTAANTSHVIKICRRLDGIPLAIELAASRTKMLSPQQIDERLDERFRLLGSAHRGGVPRQQTLRALIDWSYGLLSAPERRLLGRVAIFVRSFTLEGAIAVAAGDGVDELDVLETLESLVEQSLVSVEPAGETIRYALLDTTRAYALEKLHIAGEFARTVRLHRRYLRDRFAASWQAAEATGRSTSHNDALGTELDDVRAALDNAADSEAIIDAAELLADIGSGAWEAQGLAAEALARLEAIFPALPVDEPRLAARICGSLTILLINALRAPRAHEIASMGVAWARTTGDPEFLADQLHVFAATNMIRGDFAAAEAALAEAEAALPRPTPRLQLRIYERRAQLASRIGDAQSAVRIFERVRDLHAALGNTSGEHNTVLNLAEIEHARGNTPRAIALITQILADLRAGRERGAFAAALANLAGYLLAIDDLGAAAAAAREGIGVLAAHQPTDVLVAVMIEHLALVYAHSGDAPRAATLTGYVDASYAHHGFAREFVELATHARLSASLASALDPQERARLQTEGQRMSAQTAIAVALARSPP